MRIAVLIPDDSAHAMYRAVLPMQELAKHDHLVGIAQVSAQAGLPPLATLSDFDVVLFSRLFHPPIWRLARRLAAAGVGVVWDNDDDPTESPKDSSGYARYGGFRAPQTLLDLKTMMRAAHVVTTPSAELAARMERLRGAPATVIENYVPKRVGKVRNPDSSISVGWTASVEHRQDWDQMEMQPIFARLLAEYPRLTLISIGLRLGFTGDRYLNPEYVAFEDLPGCVAEFDIGIAPLIDVPFNRARSNIKLKEYAASGVPWLASDVGPYAGMGEREGGRLVAPGDWYERVRELIENIRLRHQLGSQGAKWSRTQTIAANAHRWETVVQDARERALRGTTAGV